MTDSHHIWTIKLILPSHDALTVVYAHDGTEENMHGYTPTRTYLGNQSVIGAPGKWQPYMHRETSRADNLRAKLFVLKIKKRAPTSPTSFRSRCMLAAAPVVCVCLPRATGGFHLHTTRSRCVVVCAGHWGSRRMFRWSGLAFGERSHACRSTVLFRG